MAIALDDAYDLFKREVGGSINFNLCGSKRARLPNWDNLPSELQTIWKTVATDVRVSGFGTYTIYKDALELASFLESILTTNQTEIELPEWEDLSPKIQTAWEVLAAATSTSVATMIKADANNFAVGTSPVGSNPVPTDVLGLELKYLGSFGTKYWNLRLGAAGASQAPFDIVRVEMAGVVDLLEWSVANNRYEATASTDLWTAFAPFEGQEIPFSVVGIS